MVKREHEIYYYKSDGSKDNEEFQKFLLSQNIVWNSDRHRNIIIKKVIRYIEHSYPFYLVINPNEGRIAKSIGISIRDKNSDPHIYSLIDKTKLKNIILFGRDIPDYKSRRKR